MDVQPESANLQHFKKQGPLTIWFVTAVSFFVYMWWEFMYQHYNDDEGFRKPVPPALDVATSDTKMWKFSQTADYRYAVDSGHISPIQFKIENGNKIHNRFAGVNEPMENI
jgi:hypothetical protein